MLAGLRDTHYAQNGYGLTGARSSQDDRNGVVTPTLAVMFKPAPATTLYQGLELGASSKLGSQWRLGGNLMVLGSSYQRGSSYQGNHVAGAPDFVAATQLAYAVAQVPGLTLSADAKYTGRTPLNASNGIELTGYALGNVGASYLTRIGGHDTTFRVAMNNISNTRYWEFSTRTTSSRATREPSA